MYNRDTGKYVITTSLFQEEMTKMLNEKLMPGDIVILKGYKLQPEDKKWITSVSANNRKASSEEIEKYL